MKKIIGIFCLLLLLFTITSCFNHTARTVRSVDRVYIADDSCLTIFTRNIWHASSTTGKTRTRVEVTCHKVKASEYVHAYHAGIIKPNLNLEFWGNAKIENGIVTERNVLNDAIYVSSKDKLRKVATVYIRNKDDITKYDMVDKLHITTFLPKEYSNIPSKIFSQMVKKGIYVTKE